MARHKLRRSKLAALSPIVAAGVLLPTSSAVASPAMDMMGSGQTTAVLIQFVSYNPGTISILTGDTVSWNDISRTHTVTDENGAWTSGRLSLGQMYSRQFNKPGVVDYYCQIHPFMTGEITVSNLLLQEATTPAAPGKPYPLRGRAAFPGGTEVTIQANTGSGFLPVTTAEVQNDGSFVALIRPKATATYRAVINDTTSAGVLLRVVDHSVSLSDVRRVGVDHLTARVTPSAPGSTVVLQLHLKERFGWWPEVKKRTNKASVAQFTVNLPRRQVKARIALTLPDGYTVLTTSKVLLVGNKPKK
jgi:plastocyanin